VEQFTFAAAKIIAGFDVDTRTLQPKSCAGKSLENGFFYSVNVELRGAP
jgi:hypothetical protein